MWAFGSRVNGNVKPYSDLDLAILGDMPLSLAEHADLANDFSKSDLSWKVDLVDWCLIGDEFRAIIEQEYFVVQAA
ncbi:nucleotidyltransferase family protein [Neisseriaceae bacterium B1]